MAPTHIRVPSYSSTSSRTMLSTTLPVRWAVAPHELLPIIPPSVQWLCVAGRGPYSSPVSARLVIEVVEHDARLDDAACDDPSSTDTSVLQYFDQSMTTAVFVHSPARLVPPPRDSSGAPWRRHTSTAATAASTLRGTTTPIGTCR